MHQLNITVFFQIQNNFQPVVNAHLKHQVFFLIFRIFVLQDAPIYSRYLIRMQSLFGTQIYYVTYSNVYIDEKIWTCIMCHII